MPNLDGLGPPTFENLAKPTMQKINEDTVQGETTIEVETQNKPYSAAHATRKNKKVTSQERDAGVFSEQRNPNISKQSTNFGTQLPPRKMDNSTGFKSSKSNWGL